MIKSMTGFGRGEVVTDECRVTVEIKAVNHRYCDINMKLPRKLNSLDNKLRGLIKKSVSRGKLDVFIGYEDLSEHSIELKVSETVSRQYVRAFSDLSDMLGIPNDVTVMRIARMPEVLTLTEEEIDVAVIEAHLIRALEQALEKFSESRLLEGCHLKEDILGKLAEMNENIT